MEKFGFVYLWFDKGTYRFYVGSHWGTEDDGYICSSDAMRKAYRRRKHDFKRRILSRIYTDRKDLLTEEQRFLDMINPEEFGTKFYNKNTKVYFYSWWANETTKAEVTKKVSEGVKRHIEEHGTHWTGRKHSEETKKKISEKKTGHKYGPCSDERREVLKKAAQGRKRPGSFSEEHRRNLSKAKLGNTNGTGNKGKPTGPKSEETKRKISEANKIWHAKNKASIT